MKKKILILYFGTFDPIHFGHVELINSVIDLCDEFHIIPSLQSPDKIKLGRKISLISYRKDMIELTLEKEGLSEKVLVNMVEETLPIPSYTYNTLKEIEKSYPLDTWDIGILMGSDNIINVTRWYKSEELLKTYKFYVFPREGYEIEKDLASKDNIILLDTVLKNISSSEIRDICKKHHPSKHWERMAAANLLQYLISPPLFRYILENKLYLDE